ERTMKELLRRDVAQGSSALETSAEIHDYLVEPRDFSFENRQRLWPIPPADEIRPCVSQHTRHVPNQFGRCPHVLSGAEISETLRSVSQRLLRAVRKRCQQVAKPPAFDAHCAPQHSTRATASSLPARQLRRMPGIAAARR